MGLVEGKIAMVTGAASGMGREGARVFAREGAAHVYVLDVNADGGNETVEIAKAGGAGATFIALDVTDESAVAATVARIVQEQGRLDCRVEQRRHQRRVQGVPRIRPRPSGTA